MRATIILALLSLSACISVFTKGPKASEQMSFGEFQQIKDLSDLKGRWGEPKDKNSMTLDRLDLDIWYYKDPDGRTKAEFHVDSAKKEIVEKIYYPRFGSPTARMENLQNTEFKGVKFEKIPVKCRHFNEVIYLDKSKGIALVAKDVQNATIDAITFSTQSLINFRIKENSEQKCR